MGARRYERIELQKTVRWDYFTATTGAKRGYLANISQGGCLLKTSELIEHRRWLRLMVQDGNVLLALVGRVIRCENGIEAFGEDDVTLYRYGIQFTFPNALSALEPQRVFAPTAESAPRPLRKI